MTQTLGSRLRSLGPGLLVAAAFIGPGTIVTASRAGASFGLTLLWAVGFSAIATAVLQEMAARLGLVGRLGLSEAMRKSLRNPVARTACLALIAVAITFGNAAYQTGNLLGASLGLELLTGVPPKLWSVLLGALAAILLYRGTYRAIQRVLVGLVLFMSVVFLSTALWLAPPIGDLLAGLLRPRVPPGSLLTVISLIGTTVVPYNLFLHASAVQEKWKGDRLDDELAACRMDTWLSVLLGGIVTGAVVVSALPLYWQGIEASGATVVADALRPVLGQTARFFFGMGLFAAGMTSAVTAPLAAAYATSGALGWSPDMGSSRFRAVWIFVIASGVVGALVGRSPTAAIVTAQAANGLLLPVIAVFLMIAVNDPRLLGGHRNRWLPNVLGGVVVLVVVVLGGVKLLDVAGLL